MDTHDRVFQAPLSSATAADAFRAMFEVASIGMAQAHPVTRRLLRVNAALCAITGYTEPELLAMTVDDLNHPDDRDRDREQYRQLASGEAPYAVDKRYRHKNGATVWVEVSGSVLRDADGLPQLAFAVVQDVTARREAEEALREADRRKDEFVAMLAHELRNPLAPIRTAAALLQEIEPADPILTRCRDVIARQSAHMGRLLDDLLDVSRLTRGRLTLQCRPVTLQDVLNDAADVTRPLLEQHHVHLAVRGIDPAVVVTGDATRLTQVFGNLLNNAVKYSNPGGEVELTMETRDVDVVVRVRDRGAGIAPDTLDRVFDLFGQADVPRDQAKGGLGIGLSLARRLIDLHGGSIEVASPGLGHGSTFVVRLPRLVVAEPRPPLRLETEPPATARRVLVVDDSPDGAEMLQLLLEQHGCQVRVVHDGQSAIAAAASFCPDLVFLDIGMPAMDGYETCRRIRQTAAGSSMAIVALTGWGQERDRERSTRAGFDRHLVKPVGTGELLQVVRECPAGRRATADR